MNTKIENLLDKPEVAQTLKSAAHRAASIARTIRGPEPVTIEMLQSACRAANTVAHTLNKICGEVADRTGRGAEIAALKAENAELCRALGAIIKADDNQALTGNHIEAGLAALAAKGGVA